MIRPRGGDFCYETDEFKTMRSDTGSAKNLGVDGVVFGILDVNGNVDVTRTRQLVDVPIPFRSRSTAPSTWPPICLAHSTTFAPQASTGFSPREAKLPAVEGVKTIRELVSKAGAQIEVIPGGGINLENARTLVDRTGVKQIHVSPRSAVPSPMLYRNPRVDMESLDGQEYERFIVLEEQVNQLCASLPNYDGI